MFEQIQSYANALGVALSAMTVGASWVASIASPNCSYDKLDGSRADGHVRELIYQTATPIAGMSLGAGMLYLLGQSWVAAATVMLAAFGFYATRMMLAPKHGSNPKGVKTSRKSQRAYSVTLSLVFTAVAIIGLILGVIGV